MQPQYIILKGRAKNITGQRFGRLVALGPVAATRNSGVLWLCQCDCGNTSTSGLSDLRHGATRSCGCLSREKTSRINFTHGMSGTKIYGTWFRMKKRCYDPTNQDYEHYGGRGISVCDEWRNSFEPFMGHVSKLPNFDEKGYSLDRIDNDGNYEPGNVRWASHNRQMRNTRNTRMLTLGDRTQSLSDWADETGICAGTISTRLNHYGYSVEEALTIPINTRGKRHQSPP